MRCDAVVVGGGIVGLAISLRLARDGASVISVFPSDQSGTASQAAGAMLGACGESTQDELERFGHLHLSVRLAAATRYPGWLEEIRDAGGPAPSLKLGTLVMAECRRTRDMQNMRAIMHAAELAHQVVETSLDLTRQLDPAERVQRHILLLQDEGAIDTDALLRSLRAALKNFGRHDLVDDEVVSLIRTPLKVEGVLTRSGQRIDAAVVVIAAGVASGALLDRAGVGGDLTRIIGGKGVMGFLQRPPGVKTADTIVLRTPNREFACGWHVVPRSDQTVCVGATNRISSELSMPLHPTQDELSALYRGVSELDPLCSESKVFAIRSAWRPVSRDGYPLIGLTDVEGLAVATGTYRNGVLLAPLIADFVAEEIASGRRAERNLYSPRAEVTRWMLRVDEALTVGLAHLQEMIDGPDGARALGPPHEVEAVTNALRDVLAGRPIPDRVSRFVLGHMTAYPLPEVVPELVVLLRRRRVFGFE